MEISDWGLGIDERCKTHGSKEFFPCALSLEPYAGLDSDYWLLTARFFDWGLRISDVSHLPPRSLGEDATVTFTVTNGSAKNCTLSCQDSYLGDLFF